MKFCFITFRSVTFAQSGQRSLKRAGIDTVLRRTPKGLEQRGCGYCLQLRESAALQAVDQLRRSQIEFGKLYRWQQDGSGEEWPV
ncbi:MAG: DUF3343 domain-containing protein [Oscillospiraceae bacterium]|nr:DUF3343 domain-containing protein [Oscillospiraceae bacterium]